jgi:hypothetical protein
MKRTRHLFGGLVALTLFGTLFGGAIAVAGEDPEYLLRIKDHRFIPAELEVPAGKKIKLIVKNEDPTPEEFESHSLNREKVIAGGRQGIVYIGPLSPGKYDIFGDFFPQTVQGMIVVK